MCWVAWCRLESKQTFFIKRVCSQYLFKKTGRDQKMRLDKKTEMKYVFENWQSEKLLKDTWKDKWTITEFLLFFLFCTFFPSSIWVHNKLQAQFPSWVSSSPAVYGQVSWQRHAQRSIWSCNPSQEGQNILSALLHGHFHWPASSCSPHQLPTKNGEKTVLHSILSVTEKTYHYLKGVKGDG